MNEFKNYLINLLWLKKPTIEEIVYDCIKKIDDNYWFWTWEYKWIDKNSIISLKNWILWSYWKYRENRFYLNNNK